MEILESLSSRRRTPTALRAAGATALTCLAVLLLSACAGESRSAAGSSPATNPQPAPRAQAVQAESPRPTNTPVVSAPEARKVEALPPTKSPATEAEVAAARGPAASVPPAAGQDPARKPEEVAADIIVYASALPNGALSEFDFTNDPASPGGRLVWTPTTSGEEMDPPPENDPNVTFKVQAQGGVPYRCWVHMKVGAPKGLSRANRLFVQFSNAVDQVGREVLKPGTGSYLTAQGPDSPGWAWVRCAPSGPGSAEPLVRFRSAGEVTVRLQAGMEGVGFDQVVLSPARFLNNPPTEAVVTK